VNVLPHVVVWLLPHLELHSSAKHGLQIRQSVASCKRAESRGASGFFSESTRRVIVKKANSGRFAHQKPMTKQMILNEQMRPTE
jgi:hypothetical protein